MMDTIFLTQLQNFFYFNYNINNNNILTFADDQAVTAQTQEQAARKVEKSQGLC